METTTPTTIEVIDPGYKKVEMVTLSNGQTVPTRTSFAGLVIVDWNSIVGPNETRDSEFRDGVIASAEMADETYWHNYGPSSYGHIELALK